MVVAMNYMTAQDKARIEGQLKELKGKRKGLSDRIGRARELGDLSENAEYHSAKEDQGHNERRIRDIEEKLASAVVVDPRDLPEGIVFVGAIARRIKDPRRRHPESQLQTSSSRSPQR